MKIFTLEQDENRGGYLPILVELSRAIFFKEQRCTFLEKVKEIPSCYSIPPVSLLGTRMNIFCYRLYAFWINFRCNLQPQF